MYKDLLITLGYVPSTCQVKYPSDFAEKYTKNNLTVTIYLNPLEVLINTKEEVLCYEEFDTIEELTSILNDL